MRCPKCSYISFEGGGRCRNCGYELSLAPEPAELDLRIKTGDEPVGPLADFELEAQPPLDLPPVPPRRTGRDADAPGEFPLFRNVEAEPRRAAKPAADPRPPAAVRKPQAVTRPAHTRQDEPELDLEAAPPMTARNRTVRPPEVDPAGAVEPEGDRKASAGARLGAALIDLLLLATIDVGVLYLTLRLTGVELSEIRILPLIPFSAFLAMLNGGYLVVLTVAGGQTLGKMATGIKVINADPAVTSDRVPLAQAVIRAAGTVLSLAPAGLGFLPALLAEDRRALHDRIAGTRVVAA